MLIFLEPSLPLKSSMQCILSYYNFHRFAQKKTNIFYVLWYWLLLVSERIMAKKSPPLITPNSEYMKGSLSVSQLLTSVERLIIRK